MSDYNDGILPEPCLRMDTHFGDEYESIEFGDGTGYIKAAPILAKVGALHEEIDRLRDERGLKEIAERIDEQYNRTCRALDSAWSATAHEVLEQAIDELSDEWVKLPVDADGVPIHIGDRVENNERVVRIVLTDGSWEPSVYVEKLPNVLHEHFCHEISHYHAPTVEDVLREFIDALDIDRCDDPDATIAEYASKLRLAGEDA